MTHASRLLRSALRRPVFAAGFPSQERGVRPPRNARKSAGVAELPYDEHPGALLVINTSKGKPVGPH